MKHILLEEIRRIIPDAELVDTPLPLCPEVILYLLGADHMRRRFSAEETRLILDRSPYWSFCWASGQAMASYILRNKGSFQGKSVLDFGSGSGVAAVAAALAGATDVVACDNDRLALEAVRVNAELNRVRVRTCGDLNRLSRTFDVVIASDVLYDPQNHPLLEELLKHGRDIYVADSRLKNIDHPRYRKAGRVTATTLPDLHEGDEFNQVNIYRAVGVPSPHPSCQWESNWHW